METKEMETKRRYMPAACDIYEQGGKIMLKLDMPGVTRESLSIHIEADELQITGRRQPADLKEGSYLVREITDADFYQAYTIDSTIDRNRIEAVLANGQLLLTLHLKETEKPRRIDINVKA